MQEKRKSKRFILETNIIMERVDGVKHKRVPVKVLDVSKTGMGFRCSEILEMNSIYQVEFTIWTGDVVQTLVTIVRYDNSTGENIYGSTFVGMPENDTSKFQIYEWFNDSDMN